VCEGVVAIRDRGGHPSTGIRAGAVEILLKPRKSDGDEKISGVLATKDPENSIFMCLTIGALSLTDW